MSTGQRTTKLPHTGTTEFAVGAGKIVYLPAPAKPAAIKALAEKLTKPFVIDGQELRLPRAAAAAIAEIAVDPAQVRVALDNDEFDHQDTPSGRLLVVLRFEAWTAGISSDGANGRARLTVATGSEAGPWPLPRSNNEPILRYKATTIARLADAVKASATEILNVDMLTRLRRNPRGIWNPATVVAAEFETQDGTLHLVHTAEGSTRTTGAQHLCGIAPEGPMQNAADIRAYIRSERARIASALAETPEDEDVWQAAKLAVMPVRLVVGVLEADGRASTAAFAEVIAEYIESVHIEPRGWDAAQQGNVVGERLVHVLHKHGVFSDTQAADILQRDHFHTPSESAPVLAARLVRAVTDPANYKFVREVILDDPRSNRLSARRVAEAVGPLLLRIYSNTPGLRTSAATALGREHLASELAATPWKVTDKTTRELLGEAEADVAAGASAWAPARAELVARSTPAVAALGLVLSDQGQAVDNVPQLRGQVSKVMSGLATTVGGLRTMADAIDRATGETQLYPPRRTTDGSEVTRQVRGGGTVTLRYDPDSRDANIELRTLALNAGVKPKPTTPPTPTHKTANEKLADLQREFMEALGAAAKAEEFMRLLTTDDGSHPILTVKKLDLEVVGPARERLQGLRDFVVNNLGSEPTVDDVPEAEPETEEFGDENEDEGEILVADL